MLVGMLAVRALLLVVCVAKPKPVNTGEARRQFITEALDALL